MRIVIFRGRDASAGESYWWKIEEFFFLITNRANVTLAFAIIFVHVYEILYYKWNARGYNANMEIIVIYMHLWCKFYTPKIVALQSCVRIRLVKIRNNNRVCSI